MTRTLILGGAGLIGSHLTEALLKTGREVHVLDTLEYCYSDNLIQSEDHPKFTFHKADACDFDKWNIGRQPWDEIYHLAGIVATADFVAHPVKSFKVSVIPLLQILEYQIKSSHPVKLLFASSSEVYGDPKVLPTPETYSGVLDFCGPRSGYSEGKRAGETLIISHAQEHGSICARVRIFNTFGERETATGNMVSTMVQDALKYGNILVNGDGHQTRTLLYVEDCVMALKSAMWLQSDLAINVGGNQSMRVLQIAGMVRESVGGKVKIVHSERPAHDIMKRQPDIRLARTLLLWSPTTPIEIGIERVVKYLRERL